MTRGTTKKRGVLRRMAAFTAALAIASMVSIPSVQAGEGAEGSAAESSDFGKTWR